MFHYYCIPQTSFIQFEMVGSPDTSKCLFTNCTVFAPKYSYLDFKHVIYTHGVFT